MIDLRPPTDADNYRVKSGRFGDRFYTDPLPADSLWEATGDDDIYPSISTVKKAVGTDWSIAMVKRLARQPDELVAIGKLDDEFERKERIRITDEIGLRGAGDRGNIVHAHAEAVLANRLPIYQMSDAAKPYVRTLEAFFAAYQPKQVAVEFVAIHRHLNAARVGRGNQFAGYGGTGDAVVDIDGGLYLVDWKSRPEDGDHGAYPEEAAQVSAYGRANYWIVADPDSPHGAKRITPPELAGGLIVSIKPDSYECFPIDLDEGFDYWSDLHAWWQGERSKTRAIGRKWAPRASQLVTDSEPAVEQPVVVDAEDAPTPTVKGNRARFDKLSAADKAEMRKVMKAGKLNPNRDDSVVAVSKLLTRFEQRPSLREMQETKVEQERSSAAASEPVEPKVNPLDVEGGPASDALVAEARLLFDMVLTSAGRDWTGYRVKEANAEEVPFQMSKLPSMRRVYLYLALCRWAAWREKESALEADELLGNTEFSGLLLSIDKCEDGKMTLGHRLGILSTEDAERLASEVALVVE